MAEPIGGQLSVEDMVDLGQLVMAGLAFVIAIQTIRYAARQTAAVAEQAKIGNEMAGTSNLNPVLAGHQQVMQLLIDHPELYPYFRESKQPPRRGKVRNRVLVTAEMLADVLNTGLHVSRQIPAVNGGLDPWPGYCSDVMSTCPALREMVEAHPDWWPNLGALQSRRPVQASVRRRSQGVL
ncbi:hypothetical protein GCM10010126_06610 [Planomonospora parontospora]|uniref:Uncharacterized protein n=1 Tax=Planomonospora parontospora TaxID=58119 RepID=A0AA37BCH7_9ACTN|nr:hypothetical protein GCM10010126_06610 [Planomonospora parontospora]